MKSYRVPIQLILTIFFLFNFLSCDQSKNRNPMGRITPVFKGLSFIETQTGHITETGNDSLGFFRIMSYDFLDSSGNRKAVLQEKYWKNDNISTYYWSTNSDFEVNGNDYLGLTIDDLPLYETGICSYIMDRSQFAYPLVIDDLKQAEVEQAVFFLWRTENNLYGAAFPLGGNGFRGVLNINKGSLGLESHTFVDGSKANKVPLMIIGFSKDPYQLVTSLMKYAMHSMEIKGGLRQTKKFPDLFRKFGWCSWNALGRYGGSLGERITADDLYDAARSFQNDQYAMPWMLIDDGWQMLDASGRKMSGFDAVRKKFPLGLSGTINNMKKKYGVPHVGVWHTITGYWEGLAPKSRLAKRYRSILMQNNGYVFPTALSADGAQFYGDWYDHLKKSGIDLLKVDNQGAAIKHVKGAVPVWDGVDQMEINMQSEIKRVFDGTVINCMAMKPEVYCHWRESAVARSSYDYLSFHETGPKGPFEVFIRTNFQNSFWFSELVWPDFDMFQSHKPHSFADALARAMSGGPIYCTDEAGKQNWDILGKVQFADGTILRPDIPGRPTLDCLFQADEAKPYKIFSKSGETALLGLWNLSKSDSVTGKISPSDVNGLLGKNFIVYEHFSGDVKVMKKDEILQAGLGKYGCSLYLIRSLKGKFVPLGLLDKFISPVGIINEQFKKDEYRAELHQGGVFGGYVKQAPKAIFVNGRELSENEFRLSHNILKIKVPGKNKTELLIQF